MSSYIHKFKGYTNEEEDYMSLCQCINSSSMSVVVCLNTLFLYLSNIFNYICSFSLQKIYIVPEKGVNVVYGIINDAWSWYKWSIKKNHFNKYKNLCERLKNRLDSIPKAHFKKLMTYWRYETIQAR